MCCLRAMRPTVYRRSERFLRRHRGAVVGVLAAVLVALIGVIQRITLKRMGMA